MMTSYPGMDQLMRARPSAEALQNAADKDAQRKLETLRDQFAIAALPALYAECVKQSEQSWVGHGYYETLAADAWALADALMAARGK